MHEIDIHRMSSGLQHLESVALLPRVTSTNAIAKRVITECIENDLSLPSAMIIACEQIEGRGRGARSWHSPDGTGIYATTLYCRPIREISLLPLEVANIIASFLQETFGLPARIKWPNDILVNRQKIAGILIEARHKEEDAYLAIGTGINISSVAADGLVGATSISEATSQPVKLAAAMEAFISWVDRRLSTPPTPEETIRDWNGYSVHSPGDPIATVIGTRTIRGTWDGIDEAGRARVRQGDEIATVSSADLILLD